MVALQQNKEPSVSKLGEMYSEHFSRHHTEFSNNWCLVFSFACVRAHQQTLDLTVSSKIKSLSLATSFFSHAAFALGNCSVARAGRLAEGGQQRQRRNVVGARRAALLVRVDFAHARARHQQHRTVAAHALHLADAAVLVLRRLAHRAGEVQVRGQRAALWRGRHWGTDDSATHQVERHLQI